MNFTNTKRRKKNTNQAKEISCFLALKTSYNKSVSIKINNQMNKQISKLLFNVYLRVLLIKLLEAFEEAPTMSLPFV